VCHDEFVTEWQALFEQSGCRGALQVQSLNGDRHVELDQSAPVVAASVFKVLVALEIESRIARGELDARERCSLRGEDRTPGPVGMSLYRDEVEMSLQDLVVAMMSISDNVATDALIDRVGLAAFNATARSLDLVDTFIEADLHTMIDWIGVDAGFADYQELNSWWETNPTFEESESVSLQIFESRALSAPRTNRTSARDMSRLLQLIWTNDAGPESACARVRYHMAHQLTRNRLASAFAPSAHVSAKSGGLMGVVRNEVGVIEYPNGDTFIASVFTKSLTPKSNEVEVNAAIGAAAAAAIASIQSGSP
jgi:beta-lactamase class A